MSILAWNEGSCPRIGSGEPSLPYGTCCYRFLEGAWFMESDDSVNGGECNTPTQQGNFENMYVLVECHAPSKSS